MTRVSTPDYLNYYKGGSKGSPYPLSLLAPVSPIPFDPRPGIPFDHPPVSLSTPRNPVSLSPASLSPPLANPQRTTPLPHACEPQCTIPLPPCPRTPAHEPPSHHAANHPTEPRPRG